MANIEKLRFEVEKLCEVLNKHGFKHKNGHQWFVGTDPKSMFGGGISFDQKAFFFLKRSGYIHDKICWKCGNDTYNSNYSFTNHLINDRIIYNICKDCYTKGKNIQKTIRNDDESSSNCYIATVCYGNINAHEVEELRRFRDYRLSKNKWGKLFIRYYYRYSPKISQKLKNKKIINSIIKQLILNPLVRIIKR
ncbi:CFI-box-CTERM domain-containing protein [Paenimyroides aestuarii]|uniref:LAGLIDADG homing endonuclease n=1 Tax=Paenimyroides aestuarii TaxID=2968490 RepID=A0ABY5NTB8_9FLAO|nr:CFI-box-CTERM domain-containing protein [Paenimyroides aestuarii]UUV21819.1 hypothetical protein NPX36_01840 [Paenimyroides aestuarii]